MCYMDAAPRGLRKSRADHHELLLLAVGLRRKDRTGHKTLSCRDVLKMADCERIETTICKRPLWLVPALMLQDETHLPKRIMLGR